MKYIISGTNIKQVDKYAIENIGIQSMVLMERAALQVALVARQKLGSNGRVVAVTGVGNNGGDAVAAARILNNRDLSTFVYVVGNPDKATEDFKRQTGIYEKSGGTIVCLNENNISLLDSIGKDDVILDGIFGVGLSREVDGFYKDVINKINASVGTKIAIDVPSGINADTGEMMGCAVKADFTVTFNANRTGIVLYPGKVYAGTILITDIGFPQKALESVERYMNLEDKDINMLPKRIENGNKGTFGKVLVVAGSDTMTGAACMSTLSALRMGAGMVKVFTTEKCGDIIRRTIPEAMVEVWNKETDYTESLVESIAWCNTVVVGPGLSQSNDTANIVETVLKSNKKTVVDADAINIIANDESLKRLFHKNVIITPHLGEMSRLCGKDIKTIQSELIECAVMTAKQYGIVTVLKDARTIISDGVHTYINTSGNSGMATAGSGDVLSGVIAAVWSYAHLSDKLKDNNSLVAALAVWIHGMAGDKASEKHGRTSMIATDIIDELENILKKAEAQ